MGDRKAHMERPLQLRDTLSTVLPAITATLHLSCCWVPALVDVISVGTASTTYIPQSRNVFLILTILILAWSINRDGLSRRNVLRIALSISILQGRKIATLLLNSTAQGSNCH